MKAGEGLILEAHGLFDEYIPFQRILDFPRFEIRSLTQKSTDPWAKPPGWDREVTSMNCPFLNLGFE